MTWNEKGEQQEMSSGHRGHGRVGLATVRSRWRVVIGPGNLTGALCCYTEDTAGLGGGSKAAPSKVTLSK